MLSIKSADIIGFIEPGTLERITSGDVGFELTPVVIQAFSLLQVIPIFMILVARLFRLGVSRCLNIVASVLTLLYVLGGGNWQSTSYFAPAYGRYVASGGKDKLGIKPPPEFMQLVDWYNELTSIAVDRTHPENEARRLELGRRILRQWAEECYVIGICRPDQVTIVSDRFRNVPDRIIHDWRVLTPGYIGIEQFFVEDER